ncbi:MAG: hypothetical protein R6W80_11645 [Haliea sp.]
MDTDDDGEADRFHRGLHNLSASLDVAVNTFPSPRRIVLTEWNATAFFPESCDTCIGDDGHTTDYHKYQLEEDRNLRLGMMSYTRDNVIAVTFVQVGGEAFEAALIPELDDLEASYYERFRSFVADGVDHTFLIGDLQQTAGGVTVSDWVSSMLAGESWETTRD